MKQSIAKKWITALESGKYRKGRRRLKTKNGRYCCLGVLTDLYNQKHPKSKVNFRSDFLSFPVQNWAGLCSDSGELPKLFGKKWSLASINDSQSKGFQGFAKVIEAIKEHWKEL